MHSCQFKRIKCDALQVVYVWLEATCVSTYANIELHMSEHVSVPPSRNPAAEIKQAVKSSALCVYSMFESQTTILFRIS